MSRSLDGALVRRSLFGLAVLALCPLASVARASGPDSATTLAAAPAATISVQALLDVYAQHNFNSANSRAALAGRQFDVRQDEFGLAVLEVTAARPAGPGQPVGAAVYKYLQQAYISCSVGGARAWTIDVGQFTAWCGVEGPESPANDNYSRSFLYTLGQPSYHAGVRVTAPQGARAAVTGYVVNGWNEIEDANAGKTLGFSMTLKPASALGIVVNAMGGREGGNTANPAGTFGGIGFSRPGAMTVVQLDGIVTWQPTVRLKLAVNADFSDASRDGFTGGHWSGQAVYARYQATGAAAVAARWEQFEDTDALRTGTRATLHSATLTAEAAVRGGALLRAELRRDTATAPEFYESDSPGKARTTLTLAQTLRF